MNECSDSPAVQDATKEVRFFLTLSRTMSYKLHDSGEVYSWEYGSQAQNETFQRNTGPANLVSISKPTHEPLEMPHLLPMCASILAHGHS